MKMIKLNEVQKFLFDARDTPVLRVAQGESFRIETDDALSGLVEDQSDDPKVRDPINDPISKALLASSPPLLNPVVGPIYVEGAARGDVLAIEIETIEPWRWGYVGILPGNGALRDSTRWAVQRDNQGARSHPDCRAISITLTGAGAPMRVHFRGLA